LPQFIYSSWAKLCSKGQDAQAQLLCITRKEARSEAGQPIMAAALIEPEGAPKKLFRVTVPNQLQIQLGTRIIVDQQPPLAGPFFTCFTDGCLADYEATPDLIEKLKHGQMLTIQAINLSAMRQRGQFPASAAPVGRCPRGGRWKTAARSVRPFVLRQCAPRRSWERGTRLASGSVLNRRCSGFRKRRLMPF
jgi:invasion protein IalB